MPVKEAGAANRAGQANQAGTGEQKTPDKDKPGTPGVTNATGRQLLLPTAAAAAVQDAPDAAGTVPVPDTVKAAPVPDTAKAAPAPDTAKAAPRTAPAKETPEKPAGPPARCLRWRFQSRELLCVTGKDTLETVLDHVIHVRAGSGQGDGSVENPYADISEALAAAEGDSPVLYIWEGVYTSRETASSSHAALLIAGSGAAVILPGGRALPAQTARGPVWAVEQKLADTIRRYSPSPYAASNATVPEETPFSGPLLRMDAGSSLRISGVAMRGNGEGVAVAVGTRETDTACGSLELSQCDISDFDTAVFSCGPVILSRNNAFFRNSAYAVDSTSPAVPAVRLGEKNSLADNGYGIHAPLGTVELRKDNLIEDSRNHAVSAGDIVLGTGNIVRRNEKGLAAAGAIRLKKDNFIQDNRSDGATAARIFLGDRNNVNGNAGAGLAVAGTGRGENGKIRLELGNLNMIMDNANDGLYCEGPGTIVLGNDNHVLRNNFGDIPDKGSGIKNLNGDVVLGNGNNVIRNGQFGIAAPMGKVVLGKNNRIKDNNRSGILTGTPPSQGPDNDITNNSRAVASDKNIQIVPPDNGPDGGEEKKE